MGLPRDVSIKIRNYKCFGGEPQGFDEILPINVIVGKNNSGKSALLDMVGYFVGQAIYDGQHSYLGNTPPYNLPNATAYSFGGGEVEIVLSTLLTERFLDEPKPIFPRTSNNGESFLRMLKNHNRRVIWALKNDYRNITISDNGGIDNRTELFLPSLIFITERLRDRIFRRLSPYRIIEPQKSELLDVRKGWDHLESNGAYATNLLRHYLHVRGCSSDLVEVTLLRALNEISKPDQKFAHIGCKQGVIGNNEPWEVQLQRTGDRWIPLSQSGDGLKTVILVLVMLILAPDHCRRSPSDFILALEELENTIHPHMLRRLLQYLRDYVVENGMTLFLTTHSSVVVDFFAQDSEAQIIRMLHNGQVGMATKLIGLNDIRDSLGDLGVRPSDLLLSNCLVWVEGPSDRIYFNRWIEIWSDGNLREGAHYQCAMYFGCDNLKHLVADDDSALDAANILRINGHIILVMDSDRSSADGELGEEKKRIANEVDNAGGYSWITYGREVENYLPPESLKDRFQRDVLPVFFEHEKAKTYFSAIEKYLGHNINKDKIDFARGVTPFFTRERLASVYDLARRLDEVCEKIREWNGTLPSSSEGTI